MPGYYMELKLSGFQKLKRVVDPVRFDRALKRFVNMKNRELGVLGRRLVKKAIQQQIWTKNAPSTIRKKGHGITLIEWGIMKKNTNYTTLPFELVIGTYRTDDNGRYNVAQIVHDGAVIKPPKGGGFTIIPPRPFFAYALFGKKITTDKMQQEGMKANSLFMNRLRSGWQVAIHNAFTYKDKPHKYKKPKDR